MMARLVSQWGKKSTASFGTTNDHEKLQRRDEITELG